MNLSLSNIAYIDPFDEEIVELTGRLGIKYVEAAPLKSFGSFENFDVTKVSLFTSFLSQKGLKLHSFQALLFGTPELYIFGEPDGRKRLKEIIMSQIELAGGLGVRNLVYGSPSTRKFFDKSRLEVESIAVDFFGELGEFAERNGTAISIEPNPPVYRNEFLQSTIECLNFVRKVNSPGLKTHIDTSTMILNGEDPWHFPSEIVDFNVHIHISEPFLAPFGVEENKNFHSNFVSFLDSKMPDKVVSLEIKQCEKQMLIDSMIKFKEVYGTTT